MNNDIIGWFTTDNGNHIPIKKGQTKVQAMNEHFNKNNSTNVPLNGDKLKNKNSLVNYAREIHNIDLSNASTEKQFAPRKGLNIDSRKLTQNELNTIKLAMIKKGMRMESNGLYDYFITYEK